MNILQSEEMAKLFCETLFRYRTEKQFQVHAFVVMPNHVHLLLTVPEGMTLARVMQLIKGGFSFSAGKLLDHRRVIWQKSFFDRRVRDTAEFEGYCEYIHNNPVRAGLCCLASEYPYSSLNPRFEVDEFPQWLKPQDTGAELMHR
jgi:putative transposase